MLVLYHELPEIGTVIKAVAFHANKTLLYPLVRREIHNKKKGGAAVFPAGGIFLLHDYDFADTWT